MFGLMVEEDLGGVGDPHFFFFLHLNMTNSTEFIHNESSSVS